MSVPVVLTVLLSIQSALQMIAESDGYNFTVKATSVVIDPIELETVAITELPFFVVGDVIPGNRDITGSKPTSIYDKYIVSLKARVDVAGLDRARKETAGWNLAQDIERALLVDPQRAGVAQYTKVLQPTIYASTPGSNQVYLDQPIEIWQRRDAGQA